jgi:hypothetical protein
LLAENHAFFKKGSIAEFDRRGRLKGGFTEITPLGRMLLRRIGVTGPDDLSSSISRNRLGLL